MLYSSSRLLGAVAICNVLGGATVAHAQGGFGRGQVSVISARDFIGNNRGGDYVYGDRLQMTVRDQELGRWIGKRVQARVFVLPAYGGDRPDSWRSLLDCEIFYTYVITVAHVPANGKLNLGLVNSLGWMRMPDSTLARGRFLIVFESASDNNPIFRLNRADREKYFSRGLIIRASHANTMSVSAPSERWLASDEQRRRREMGQISADRVCYRFEVAETEEDRAPQLAQMRRCPKTRDPVAEPRADG